jgi:hypothetical protein
MQPFQIEGQADQTPFACGSRQAAQGELAKAQHFFDDANSLKGRSSLISSPEFGLYARASWLLQLRKYPVVVSLLLSLVMVGCQSSPPATTTTPAILTSSPATSFFPPQSSATAPASPTFALVPTPTPTAHPEVNLELVGHMGGASQALALRGHHAYIGVGLRLEVLDISHPSAPRSLARSAPLLGLVSSVALAGEHAFVLTEGSALSVLSISDPGRLPVVGALKLEQPAHGLAVAEGYAYVAGGEAGLIIIDVRAPETPRLVQRFQTQGQAIAVGIAGHFAYVIASEQQQGNWGLEVINLANPTMPAMTGSLELKTPHALAIAVKGNYAFVAAHGLHIVDVSNPFHPRFVGSYREHIATNDVVVADNYALVSSDIYCDVVAVCPRTVSVVDISNPAEPTALTALSLPRNIRGAGRGMVVQDGLLYLANELGLQVLKGPPWKTVGEYRTVSRVEAVSVANGMAYGGDGDRAFHIFDVHNPNTPELVSTLEGIGAPDQVHLADGYAVLGLWNTGFAIVDVRQAQQPELLARVEGLGSSPLAVRDETVYLIHPDMPWITGSRLSLYDMANPIAPRPISSLWVSGGDYTWLALADHYALLGTYALLEIVDIADAQSLRKVGEIALDPPEQACYLAIAVEGRYVYLLRESAVEPFLAELVVYEFAAPAELRPIAKLTLSRGNRGLTVAAGYAYVVGTDGLSVVDISDPSQPREVGVSDYGGGKIVAEGDYLYIAGGRAGLLILRVSRIAPGGS